MTTNKTQSLKRKREKHDDEKKVDEKPEDYRSRRCPYLDTINRSVLDFDFQKLCSVSLSHINVYACLVCGKYYQGRNRRSHAHTHSLQSEHHVFLNLETHKFYCLPNDYEIIDQSLEDIVYVLSPTFTAEQIKNIDSSSKYSRANDDNLYLPGIVGLNNIKANDYCNVIIQALSHVTPLRSYFLSEHNYAHLLKYGGDQRSLLLRRFGELVRKLWNPINFKTHVSPHEMLQAVVLCSNKRFQFTEQGDCYEFLIWFLNSLNEILGGLKKSKKTIISNIFRGRMRVTSVKVPPTNLSMEDQEQLLQTEEYQEKVSETSFLYLTCDLPDVPLHPEERNSNIIPHVNILDVLRKFDGVTPTLHQTNQESFMKTYELIQLPRYLILNFKRFSKATFNKCKNTTVVSYATAGLEFGQFMNPEARAKHKSTVYNLVANVIHDGKPGAGNGTYRSQVYHKGCNQWFELENLRLNEILPLMISLPEVYVQIYELSSETTMKNQDGCQ